MSVDQIKRAQIDDDNNRPPQAPGELLNYNPRALKPIDLVPTPYATPSDGQLYPLDSYRDDHQVHSAVAYAEYAKDQYLSAKAQSADLPATFAAFLIPLGGAALGLGMTGNSGAPVTALGLAGATSLGGGKLSAK
jgi:hypothetical protein